MSNILRSEAADLSLSNLGGHEWVPPTSLKTWRLFSQIYKIPDSEFQEFLSGTSGSLTGGIESGQHHWGIILGKDTLRLRRFSEQNNTCIRTKWGNHHPIQELKKIQFNGWYIDRQKRWESISYECRIKPNKKKEFNSTLQQFKSHRTKNLNIETLQYSVWWKQ